MTVFWCLQRIVRIRGCVCFYNSFYGCTTTSVVLQRFLISISLFPVCPMFFCRRMFLLFSLSLCLVCFSWFFSVVSYYCCRFCFFACHRLLNQRQIFLNVLPTLQAPECTNSTHIGLFGALGEETNASQRNIHSAVGKRIAQRCSPWQTRTSCA